MTWPGGQECTLHILVVHAMIILLTYGPQCIHDSIKFDHLLEAWFPTDRKQMPKVKLLNIIIIFLTVTLILDFFSGVSG